MDVYNDAVSAVVAGDLTPLYGRRLQSAVVVIVFVNH